MLNRPCPSPDSECGEESFEEPARFHRGPAAAADAQLEGLVVVAQTPLACVVCVVLINMFVFSLSLYLSLSLSVLVGNSLNELPSSLSSLSSLRTLDVSDNVIVQLPKCLANIRTLEVCVAAYTLDQGWQTVGATMGSIM